jgi:hypothetical protein
MRLPLALNWFACSGLGILLSAGTALAAANPEISSPETDDECVAAEGCVDQYLWSLYDRTPKLDTVTVSEAKEVKVKRKGRTKFVTVTMTRAVNEDYTWKDAAAAEKVGMSVKDYVIGGMDQSFRLTLYRALRALDDAGFVPGITSAFRDDYRQSIATGYKAHDDCSYHGGSRHGGYGHGLAADIVSVRGKTRAERLVASDEMWKWIDKHEKELGVGRPYLDKDPMHVGPIDGKEYAHHRGHGEYVACGVKYKEAPAVLDYNVASAQDRQKLAGEKPRACVVTKGAKRRVSLLDPPSQRPNKSVRKKPAPDVIPGGHRFSDVEPRKG